MVMCVARRPVALPGIESFQDNGPSRERMQHSSSCKRQQAQGNNYTPFPTTHTCSGAGRMGVVSPVALALPTAADVAGGGPRNGRNPQPRPGRQETIPRLLPQPWAQPASTLLPSPASLPPSTDSNPVSTNDSQCALVTFYTPPRGLHHSSPSFPSSSSSSTTSTTTSLPSEVYLYLYKNLPKVTSDEDLDRLGRTMRGIKEGCFYYPDLDSPGARSMLRHAPEGTFLVRDSSDPRYLFSLSVVTGRGATSVRIQYYMGFFQLDCDHNMKLKLPRFETLLDLLDFHMAVSGQQQGKQYRWQETSRRTDMVIKLTTPRRHAPPSLAHLARVSVNRCLPDPHTPHRSSDLLPVADSLRQFLRDYPFKV